MDIYLTLIMGWGPNWPPRQFTTCSGQLMSIAQYTAVFSLIGTIYGGDGRTTFRLPDLRGRAGVAAGQSPGTSYVVQGALIGTEENNLTVLELPIHNHVANTQNLSVVIGASSLDASSATPAKGNSLGKVVDATSFGDIHLYGTGAPDVALNAGGVSGTAIIGNSGGGEPFTIWQPTQAIQFIFCMEGVFPPRN